MVKTKKNEKIIKGKIIEILTRENRALSIREASGALVVSGVKISQPMVLKYLKELEKENKVQEVKQNGKKISNNRSKNASKKAN